MKQVNPKFNLKLGANLNENLDNLNESQITQLYELFQETKKASPTPTSNEH